MVSYTVWYGRSHSGFGPKLGQNKKKLKHFFGSITGRRTAVRAPYYYGYMFFIHLDPCTPTIPFKRPKFKKMKNFFWLFAQLEASKLLWDLPRTIITCFWPTPPPTTPLCGQNLKKIFFCLLASNLKCAPLFFVMRYKKCKNTGWILMVYSV